jgi:hypothetical protein
MAYGAGAFVGFVVYSLIAALLCGVYAATYTGAAPATAPNPANPPPPEEGWALFASALARTVLGEEIRPPSAK